MAELEVQIRVRKSRNLSSFLVKPLFRASRTRMVSDDHFDAWLQRVSVFHSSPTKPRLPNSFKTLLSLSLLNP